MTNGQVFSKKNFNRGETVLCSQLRLKTIQCVQNSKAFWLRYTSSSDIDFPFISQYFFVSLSDEHIACATLHLATPESVLKLEEMGMPDFCSRICGRRRGFFRISLVLLLFTCFAVQAGSLILILWTFLQKISTQVVDLVLKYTASGSSMAFDRVRDPMLKYPDVFLCPRPGFKVEEMSKLSNISENPWLAPLTLLGTDKVRSHAEVFMTQNCLWFLSLKETLPIWQSAPANASQLLNWYLKSTFQPKENVVFLDIEAKTTGFVSYMYGQCTKIIIPMVSWSVV